MSAAVAPPGAGLDANALVDLDLLQGELDAARGQVEMWCAQRELAMKEAVAAHKTNMMESEEQYVKLVEREKDLAASGEERLRSIPPRRTRHWLYFGAASRSLRSLACASCD